MVCGRSVGHDKELRAAAIEQLGECNATEELSRIADDGSLYDDLRTKAIRLL
jgi:hypothetical protein